MKYRPIWIIGLVTVLVIVIGGSAVLAHEPSEGRAGRSELRFLEGMIDHHQMALDMANDCLAKATTESVKSLCQNVITAQRREILTMRGWLLSWYGMDYQPMSMLAGSQPGAPSSGGMMQGGMMGMMDGDMAGMMNQMSDMMTQMSSMMQMMQGGMMGGDGMGMGGMQGMQGGMMPGNQPPMGMGMMGDRPMQHLMQVLSVMHTVTVGGLLERTADLDPTTPLMTVFDGLIESGDFPLDMAAMMPLMNSITPMQMMSMFSEMQNLTLADIQEMQGHLDDGANALLMTLMQHHMDVMAAGSAGPSTTTTSTDHSAHHPSGQPTPAPDHSAHQQGAGNSDHAGMGLSDPPMTMGMFAGLNSVSGVDYDIAWLEAMIDHHDDALHMAERILEAAPEGVGHAEVRELATQIIRDQTAEIALMEGMIVDLSG